MAIVINEREIHTSKYSLGEQYIKIDEIAASENVHIVAKLYSADAIIQLLLSVDAVRRMNPKAKINLTIPYLPYARQDKLLMPGEACGAKVIADLINGLHCNSVTIYDPHSETIVHLLNNCRVVELSDIITATPLSTLIQSKRLTLIAPDRGAKLKVEKISKRMKIEVIYTYKSKNYQSGLVTYEAIEADINGKDCIILDDICDTAQTAITLAKLLKKEGIGKLYLYVTHGIFARGIEILKEHFDHIYCYHTMLDDRDVDDTFLTIFEKEKSLC